MKAIGLILVILSCGVLYLVAIKKQSIAQIWTSFTSFFSSSKSAAPSNQSVSSSVVTSQTKAGKSAPLGMIRAMQPNG